MISTIFFLASVVAAGKGKNKKAVTLGKCSIYGDPHVTNFLGVKFDCGGGWKHMAKTADCFFNVQTYSETKHSLNEKVAVRFGQSWVLIEQHSGFVKVVKKKLTKGDKVEVIKNNTEGETEPHTIIIKRKRIRVEVKKWGATVEIQYKGSQRASQSGGYCGSWDRDPLDTCGMDKEQDWNVTDNEQIWANFEKDTIQCKPYECALKNDEPEVEGDESGNEGDESGNEGDESGSEVNGNESESEGDDSEGDETNGSGTEGNGNGSGSGNYDNGNETNGSGTEGDETNGSGNYDNGSGSGADVAHDTNVTESGSEGNETSGPESESNGNEDDETNGSGNYDNGSGSEAGVAHNTYVTESGSEGNETSGPESETPNKCSSKQTRRKLQEKKHYNSCDAVKTQCSSVTPNEWLDYMNHCRAEVQSIWWEKDCNCIADLCTLKDFSGTLDSEKPCEERMVNESRIVQHVDGYDYATLDFADPKSPSGECHWSPTLQVTTKVPTGWELVPANNENIVEMLSVNSFGVSCIMASDGFAYPVGGNTDCTEFTLLTKEVDYHTCYSVSECPSRVLIRRKTATECTSTVEFQIQSHKIQIEDIGEVSIGDHLTSLKKKSGTQYEFIRSKDETLLCVSTKDAFHSTLETKPAYGVSWIEHEAEMKEGGGKNTFLPLLHGNKLQSIQTSEGGFCIGPLNVKANMCLDMSISKTVSFGSLTFSSDFKACPVCSTS